MQRSRPVGADDQRLLDIRCFRRAGHKRAETRLGKRLAPVAGLAVVPLVGFVHVVHYTVSWQDKYHMLRQKIENAARGLPNRLRHAYFWITGTRNASFCTRSAAREAEAAPSKFLTRVYGFPDRLITADDFAVAFRRQNHKQVRIAA